VSVKRRSFERKYFDEYYTYYKKRDHIVAKNIRALRWSNRYVNIDLLCGRGRSALDIGCAYGYIVDFLQTVGYQAVGIDVSQYATKHSKRVLQNSPEIVLCDVQKVLPFRCKFDLITCFETLEHLPKPSAAIANMINALEKGGVFVVTTPNKDFFLRRVLDHDTTHVNVNSLKNWKQKFGKILKDGEIHVDTFPPFINIPKIFSRIFTLKPFRVGIIITVLRH
jgi:SAM-dependent methyltransferase